MNRTPVASSQVSSIGYDPKSETLEVEFNQGAVYQYSGVPERVFAELMASPSKGQFLNRNVKDLYPFERV